MAKKDRWSQWTSKKQGKGEMGKPFNRLSYEPSEAFCPDDWIGLGEAISMITDLLVLNEKREFIRRRVDNDVRYAIKKGRLSLVHTRHLNFGHLAAWANNRYGEGNPDMRRMGHSVNVAINGIQARGKVGSCKIFRSIEDCRQENETMEREITRLKAELAKTKERDLTVIRDAEIGRKVRAGGRKGGGARRERCANTR